MLAACADFSGLEFQVYRVPANASAQIETSEQLYYIAEVGGHAFSADECSTFSASSPLLDYGTSHGWATGGHPRFSHLGWVLGGEFAMYYFGATVINEVADNFFVVPSDTVSYGWKCKLFSVVLEVFQLGALFPAAAFEYSACLRYMNPLNADLHLIRGTIVTFGYCCWGSLAVIGFFSLIGLMLHVVLHGIVTAIPFMCPAGRMRQLLTRIMRPCVVLHERIFTTDDEDPCAPCCNVFLLYLLIASVPMVIAGSVLGVLVILGQGTKQEPQQRFAAVLLLLDVLFKLAATACGWATGAISRATDPDARRRRGLQRISRMGSEESETEMEAVTTTAPSSDYQRRSFREWYPGREGRIVSRRPPSPTRAVTPEEALNDANESTTSTNESVTNNVPRDMRGGRDINDRMQDARRSRAAEQDEDGLAELPTLLSAIPHGAGSLPSSSEVVVDLRLSRNNSSESTA